MEPFAAALDFKTGIIDSAQQRLQRRLSDMRAMYADRDAVEAALTRDNPLIYEVYGTDLPEREGQVLYCTTIIYPGTIGDEYYMTKGHFHALRDRAEIYLGLAGEGYLLLATDAGDARALKMEPGIVTYVPPYWAHRTINCGDVPFIFLAAWPGDAGHDYATIETMGFPKLLVRRGGQPTLIDNPRYRVSS